MLRHARTPRKEIRMASTQDRYPDHPPAGPVLTGLRVVMLLVFVGLGVLGAARGQWFVPALMLFGCWGVVSALRTGKGLKRLDKR